MLGQNHDILPCPWLLTFFKVSMTSPCLVFPFFLFFFFFLTRSLVGQFCNSPILWKSINHLMFDSAVHVNASTIYCFQICPKTCNFEKLPALQKYYPYKRHLVLIGADSASEKGGGSTRKYGSWVNMAASQWDEHPTLNVSPFHFQQGEFGITWCVKTTWATRCAPTPICFCPSPMKIHPGMWVQWQIVHILTIWGQWPKMNPGWPLSWGTLCLHPISFCSSLMIHQSTWIRSPIMRILTIWGQ